MERWAKIQESPNYEVSDHGRIKGPKGIRKPSKQSTGYYYIGLHLPGRGLTNFLVHRLVATYFCEGYKEGLIVAHRDGNKDNNRWDNLRWTTQKDNMHDKKIHGTAYNVPRGQNHYRCRFVAEAPKYVKDIRERHANGTSMTALAKEYGLGLTTVKNIVDRHTWKHI